MVITSQQIDLVAIRLIQELDGYHSIFFEWPKNFTFEAGDWIDVHFLGRHLNGGITYSLSSSPTEPELRITFREGVSEFKRALQSIKKGDKLVISQYGNDYGFYLKKNSSSVLIAGGVGIAPFRSMLKEMFDQQESTTVQLLYINKDNHFLFQKELDEWSTSLPNLSINYIATNDLNRKQRQKMILALVKSHNQNFYISGPPSMVESTEHLLIDDGVPVRNIRIDSFGGY